MRRPGASPTLLLTALLATLLAAVRGLRTGGPLTSSDSPRMRVAHRRVVGAVIVALAVLAPAAASSYAASPGSGIRWTTSWATAQHTTGPEVSDQTSRTVVHLTQGGDRVRVRLSNTVGEQALQIGAATVAVRAAGAAAIEGTMRTLTFSRSPAVEVPGGGYVTSDPVRLSTSPQQDLVVSVFLPGTVSPSAHGAAFETSYLTGPGAGDHSADLGGGVFTEETESYLVVSAVDVRGHAAGTVMVTGGSVTDGHGSRSSGTLGTGPVAPPNSRWSDVLARRFSSAERDGAEFAVANAGIGGNTASRECGALAGFPGGELANVEDRYDRDVLGLSGVTHVVIYAGTNDVGIGAGCPSEEIIAAFTRLSERAHAEDVQVVIATITPRASYTALQNQERFEVNDWLRRGGNCSGVCDGIVDFDTVIAWYASPNAIDPRYDSGDGIHPNAEGYRAMGNAFDLQLFS
jgi:lysophospholipase L1-like esterase